MDPLALLEHYLTHRDGAPRPFSADRGPQRLLVEPVDQPLTQALADHVKPAAAPARQIA